MLMLSLVPPVLLLVMMAGCWTFWLVVRWPERVLRMALARAHAAISQGLVCAAVWSGIQMWLEQAIRVDHFRNGLLTGLAWAGTIWESHSRYHATT
jgi:hypothetical protein